MGRDRTEALGALSPCLGVRETCHCQRVTHHFRGWVEAGGHWVRWWRATEMAMMLATSVVPTAVSLRRERLAGARSRVNAAGRSVGVSPAVVGFKSHGAVRLCAVSEVSSTAEGEAKPARGRGGSRGGRGPKREISVQLEELVAGQELKGKVKTVQSYGCFVDVGARTDGLLHISELSGGFVKDVNDVVSVGQEVSVYVKDVDTAGGKLSLTMRSAAEAAEAAARAEEGKARKSAEKAALGSIKAGSKIEGTIMSYTDFGVFIEVAEGVQGLLHVSELADENQSNPQSLGEVGAKVTVRVKDVDSRRGKIGLSMKESIDVSAMTDAVNAKFEDEGEGVLTAFELAFVAAGIDKPAEKAVKTKKAAPKKAAAAKAEVPAPAAAKEEAKAAEPVAVAEAEVEAKAEADAPAPAEEDGASSA